MTSFTSSISVQTTPGKQWCMCNLWNRADKRRRKGCIEKAKASWEEGLECFSGTISHPPGKFLMQEQRGTLLRQLRLSFFSYQCENFEVQYLQFAASLTFVTMTQLRDLENIHHEKVSDIAVVTLEKLMKNELEEELPDDLRMVRMRTWSVQGRLVVDLKNWRIIAEGGLKCQVGTPMHKRRE